MHGEEAVPHAHDIIIGGTLHFPRHRDVPRQTRGSDILLSFRQSDPDSSAFGWCDVSQLDQPVVRLLENIYIYIYGDQ